jgi:hypothetical protein
LLFVSLAFHFDFGIAADRAFWCHDVTSSCQPACGAVQPPAVTVPGRRER